VVKLADGDFAELLADEADFLQIGGTDDLCLLLVFFCSAAAMRVDAPLLHSGGLFVGERA